MYIGFGAYHSCRTRTTARCGTTMISAPAGRSSSSDSRCVGGIRSSIRTGTSGRSASRAMAYLGRYSVIQCPKSMVWAPHSKKAASTSSSGSSGSIVQNPARVWPRIPGSYSGLSSKVPASHASMSSSASPRTSRIPERPLTCTSDRQARKPARLVPTSAWLLFAPTVVGGKSVNRSPPGQSRRKTNASRSAA